MTGRPERVGAFRGGRARRIHRPSATLDASPVGLPCRWRPSGLDRRPDRAGTHEPCRRDPGLRLRTDRRSRPSRPFRPPTQSIGDGPHEHSARHRHHSPDLHRAPARSGQRPGHRPGRRGLRRPAQGDVRCDRPPPGGHRSRRRRRRRPGGRQPRPRNRAGAGGPQRRAQRRRPQRHGGWDRSRPRRHDGARHRRRGPDRLGADRSDGRGIHERRGRARAGHRVR